MNKPYKCQELKPFENRDFDILRKEYCFNCGRLIVESNLKNEFKTPTFIDFCYGCWEKLHASNES